MDGGHLTRKVPRKKPAKPCTHQPWWPPLSYGCHGAPLPAPSHVTISQNVVGQDCIVKAKKILLILPSSHAVVWFVSICASRINLPTQNIMLTILNALSLACTKLSIGSIQAMALAGVPVRELFNNVGYWRRTRAPRSCQRAECTKKSDPRKTPKVIQVLF